MNKHFQNEPELVFDKAIDKVTNEPEKGIEPSQQWSIRIPRIDVLAEVSEGSTLAVLKNYVGHIKGTGVNNSNICLAAHTNTANYSSGNFYFDKLNQLEKGDEVIYTYSNLSKKFCVNEIKIIEETDLTILASSNSTKLTLITCIKGKYHQRLCVICEEKNT